MTPDAIMSLDLNPRQIERLKTALANLAPGAGVVRLEILERNRIRLRSPHTGQQWTIGPRGRAR